MPQSLTCYQSEPHPCPYLPGRDSSMLVADPDAKMTPVLYEVLCENGFRRSGTMIYRPACPGCQSCVPIRLPVADFSPQRIHRRTWRLNSDLRVTVDEPVFRDRDYRLFKQYLESRHPEGTMQDLDEMDYLQFLAADWSATRFCRFLNGHDLLAVAVVDKLPDGLSAVYTFYDPTQTRRSLGSQAILWTIRHALQLGVDWVYLGYWIADSPKMAYKSRYLPHERWLAGEWRRVERPGGNESGNRVSRDLW